MCIHCSILLCNVHPQVLDQYFRRASDAIKSNFVQLKGFSLLAGQLKQFKVSVQLMSALCSLALRQEVNLSKEQLVLTSSLLHSFPTPFLTPILCTVFIVVTCMHRECYVQQKKHFKLYIIIYTISIQMYIDTITLSLSLSSTLYRLSSFQLPPMLPSFNMHAVVPVIQCSLNTVGQPHLCHATLCILREVSTTTQACNHTLAYNLCIL